MWVPKYMDGLRILIFEENRQDTLDFTSRCVSMLINGLLTISQTSLVVRHGLLWHLLADEFFDVRVTGELLVCL